MRRSCRLQIKKESEEEEKDGASDGKKDSLPPLLNQIKKTSRNSQKIITTPQKSSCNKPPQDECELSAKEDVSKTKSKVSIATPAKSSHKKEPQDKGELSAEEDVSETKSKVSIATPARSSRKKKLHDEDELSAEDDVSETKSKVSIATPAKSSRKKEPQDKGELSAEEDVSEPKSKVSIATPARSSRKKKPQDESELSAEEDVSETKSKVRIATPARSSCKKKQDAVIQLPTLEEENVLETDLKKASKTPARSTRKKKHEVIEISTEDEESASDINSEVGIPTPAKGCHSNKKHDKMEEVIVEEEEDILVKNLKKRISSPVTSVCEKHHDDVEGSTEEEDEPLLALKALKDQEVNVADKEMKPKQKRKSVACKTKNTKVPSDGEDVDNGQAAEETEFTDEKKDVELNEDGSTIAEEIDSANEEKDVSCRRENETSESNEEDGVLAEPVTAAVEETKVAHEKEDISCDVKESEDYVRDDGSISDSDSYVIDFNSEAGRNTSSACSLDDEISYEHGEEKSCDSPLQDTLIKLDDVEDVEDVEDESRSMNAIENPVPLKVITCQKTTKRTSFNIDRSKYETSYLNKFADNPLMKSLCDLKSNNLFQDHMKMKRLNVKEKEDVLSLDSVTLVSDTPAQSSSSGLSSRIQTSVTHDLYIDTSTAKSNEIDTNKNVEKLMKRSVLSDDLESMERAPKLFKSKNSVKVESKKKREETAGKGWYHLPKTEVTDKIKNDLQLIKMRNVLDSKHHYKRNDTNKLPKYFQMGTIVEGAHEFYSARVPKKKRKNTMVDELLDDAEFRRKNKQKYIEIRKKQMSGGKGFYKKLKDKGKKHWERT